MKPGSSCRGARSWTRWLRLPVGRPWVETVLDDIRLLAIDSEETFTTFSPDGTILSVAGAVDAMFGCSASELVGRSILDFYPAEKRELLKERIARVADTGFSVFEDERVLANGDRIPVEVRGRFIPEQGVYVNAVRDISARRREEEEARILQGIARADSRIGYLARDSRAIDNFWLECCRAILEEVGLDRVAVVSRTGSGETELLATLSAKRAPSAQGEAHLVSMSESGIAGAELRLWGIPGTISPGIADVLHRLGSTMSREWKLIQAEVHRSENEIRAARILGNLSLAEQIARCGSWSWDPVRDEVVWSEGMYRLHGLDPAESPPTIEEYFDLVHPTDRSRVEASIRSIQESGGEALRDFRILRRDGAIRIIEPRLSITLGENDQVTEIRGTAIDITERAEFEERLGLLERAVEQTPVSIVITGDQGEIEYANAAFTRATGYSLQEVLGLNPRFLKSGNTPASVYRKLWDTISSGMEWRGRLQNRRKDGTLFWEDVSISPALGEDGATRHFIAVKMDVSEQLALSEDLAETRGQLHQSQKLESLGRLSAGIAHDFNNLLGVIMGYASLLMRATPPGDASLPRLRKIEEAGNRAAELTRKLLAFGRRQAMEPRVIELNAHLQESSEMLDRLLGERFALRMDLDSRVGCTRIDPGQLDQVLMNLVVNARDAMPAGGEILIATRPGGGRLLDEHVRSGGSPPVQIVVRDTGTGIEPEVLRHIFEPFFTTKVEGSGTGLGLATAHGIIAQSGGDIEVQSRPGMGTEFRINLPGAAAGMKTGPKIQTVGTRMGSESILVVDDQEALGEMLVAALGDLGYRVASAASGVEALALLEKPETRVDLLLSDLVLPRMSGLELASEAVKRFPDLKVLIMTGYGELEIEKVGGLTPDCALIRKPFGLDAIALQIREVLDTRRAA